MNNLLSVKGMVKPEYVKGNLPSDREAYLTLIRLALPSVIEMVLTSLIGAMDTMMVSGIGEAAVAAVGLTGQPRMLIMSIFFALNVGLIAIIARRKGEERREDANQTLRSGITVILILSVFLTAVGVIFSKQFMVLAGAIKGETLELSDTYFKIIIAASPINAVTMAINAAQRGIGNMKITLYVNSASNIVNVIFNYLLIDGHFGFPKLGVAGAAIASVIGMAVGLVLCIWPLMRKNSYLKLEFNKSWRLEPSVTAPLFNVGGNAVLEQIALRIGFFAFARIVAGLGTNAFAAHQACGQFTNITYTFGDGIGVAGTSLVGCYLGKKRPDIAMIYGKIGQRIAFMISLLLMTLTVLLRTPLVSLFLENKETIKLASDTMLIIAMLQPVQMSATVISGCLRGSGDTKFVALIMLICITVIRPCISVIVIFVFDMGLIGAWLSTLIDLIIRFVFVYVRFAGFKWAVIKV